MKTQKFLAVIGGLMMAASTVSALEWSVNGHDYEAVVTAPGISWADANSQAMAMGGYLATMTSAEENAWVYEKIVLPSFGTGNGGNAGVQAWLGGLKGASQTPFAAAVDTVGSEWSWVTGETFTYTNWAPGEPNNSGGVESFITINRFGTQQWNDEGAWPDGVMGFIVEKNSVPDGGSTLMLAGIALVSLAGLRRKL